MVARLIRNVSGNGRRALPGDAIVQQLDELNAADALSVLKAPAEASLVPHHVVHRRSATSSIDDSGTPQRATIRLTTSMFSHSSGPPQLYASPGAPLTRA